MINVGAFKMLPAAPDTCQECAVKHEPHMPHNKQSLFYQMKFNAEHGRWPTWKDAMAHCTPELQAQWAKILKDKFNIDI